MKPNVGAADRAIRAIVGIAALAAWFFDLVEGTLGIIVLVVGVVMIATAVFRWCPPYALLDLNTGASKD
jgi:hypothetical protein